MNLHMQRWGQGGPPVLLVHGSVMNGEATWIKQRPLADRWSLLVMDRRGYYPNPPVDLEDFEVDALDIADLLGEGVHLVGHSHGRVASMLAAAKRPEGIRSLTVIEPPAFGVADADPEVRSLHVRSREYWEHGPRDPEAFMREFLKMAGANAPLPSSLPPALLPNAKLLMVERDPGEAVIPLDDLRRAAFPKLVVSGAHSPVFEKICDALAKGLGAERALIPGAGHGVPWIGEPLNERLEAFLQGAEAMGAER